MSDNRRKFIQQATGLAGIALLPSALYSCAAKIQANNNPNAADIKTSFFEISLAQWSLHRALRSKKINNLDFPVITKKEFGINAVEYVNTFFNNQDDAITSHHTAGVSFYHFGLFKANEPAPIDHLQRNLDQVRWVGKDETKPFCSC